MTDSISRRAFLATTAAATAGTVLSKSAAAAVPPSKDIGGREGLGGPIVLSSGNGEHATSRAFEMLKGGADPLDAIVAGIKIVEDDPNDMSVGFGGLPNEEGIVELDASVMHGPTHRAGAVGALRNIKNPAAVARDVARHTDHVLIVGAGALKFAKRRGFEEENLLTEQAREAWLRWRTKNGRCNGPVPDAVNSPVPMGKKHEGHEKLSMKDGVPFTYGTIHCSALTAGGDLAGCTSTSGLSWKLSGRVGDSPIIGAGCYTDNAVGSAGATGLGETVMQVCGAHSIVMRMEAGDSPTDGDEHEEEIGRAHV